MRISYRIFLVKKFIMTKSLSSDCSWFKYYLARSDETDLMQKVLVANAEHFKLDKAESMISIGPGSGSFDAGVIKACVSDLEHYIGVEPDKDMHDSLTANMKDLNGVKVALVNDSVPEWMGPKDPVDIVLVSHVLYFIKDPVVAIQQFYKWLKPGGSVIFLHGYDFGLFIEIAQENDIFCPVAYCVQDLKGDLHKEGFHNFEEIQFKVHFTFPCDDEDFLRSYFKRWIGDVPEEKMLGVLQTFRDRWQGEEAAFEYVEACIRLTKPQNI